MRFRQAIWDEPLLFEKPSNEVARATPGVLPPDLERRGLDLPNLPEWEVVRHFTRLSQMTFGIDSGFYPLGAGTMKDNPKGHREPAGLPGAPAPGPAHA